MSPFVQNLISSLSGVIIGSAITVWLTYKFQVKILNMQLEAQDKSHKELLQLIELVGTTVTNRVASSIHVEGQRSRLVRE